MSRQETKRIPPTWLIPFYDEMAGRLAEVSEKLNKLDRLDQILFLQMPSPWVFPRQLEYQWLLVPAGQTLRVWFMQVPDRAVAVISEVGCNIYDAITGSQDFSVHTYFRWIIDREEKVVQHQIAPVNNLKEYRKGLPAQNTIEWVGVNTSGIDHIYEVKCDGYFIRDELYAKIVGNWNQQVGLQEWP